MDTLDRTRHCNLKNLNHLNTHFSIRYLWQHRKGITSIQYWENRCNADEYSELGIYATQHIFRSVTQSSFNVREITNNSQIDLSDYHSLTSSIYSLVWVNKISHIYITTLSSKHCQSEKKNSDYYSTLESSSDGNSSWTFLKCIHDMGTKMWLIPSNSKHMFCWEQCICSLHENTLCNFPQTNKWCLRYDHQTRQLSQVGWDEHNWSIRYLLCQDIFYIKQWVIRTR